MNDNSPAQTFCEIQMHDGDEQFTAMCSQEPNAELVELAAQLLRANPNLAYVEMQDLSGSKILIWRGKHPEGKFDHGF